MKKIVLVVDDDKTDVMAIQRALKEMVQKNEIEVEVFHDGDEVVARLKDASASFPYMMFLDLNMTILQLLQLKVSHK